MSSTKRVILGLVGIVGMGGLVGVSARQPVCADPAPTDVATVPLLEAYAVRARLEVPVPEVSGLTSLPPQTGPLRSFLAVSDDGRTNADGTVIHDGLFRLGIAVGENGDVELEVAERIDVEAAGLAPDWAPDLEAIVPIPFRPDLYLLGAERNPDDATDTGANALWVMRYPAAEDEPNRARMLAHFVLPDQPDDAVNDRFEAVAVPPGASTDGRWTVLAFKERTARPDRVPVVWTARLVEAADGWRLDGGADGRAVPPPRPWIVDRAQIGAPADAAAGPDGRVWILDRWRREIHVAALAAGAEALPRLAVEARYDFLEVVRRVPGEVEGRNPFELAAPGGGPAGFGRHEAMCFDGAGWLWLGADLGGGNPSVMTALAPRERAGR